MQRNFISNDFQLENGQTINDLIITFHTYGTLNKQKDNVIWVCHALTANSDVLEWWSGLFGNEKLFDPRDYFIVCANVIGSCYGSTGPVSPGEIERPKLDRFPDITIRDMVHAHELLRGHLGLEKIQLLIGASLGGQQALEWSIAQPEVFQKLILIATNAKHSPYGIAFNESQRMAIRADQSFGKGIHGGKQGLAVARSIAMLSYRSYEGYAKTQSEDSDNSPVSDFRAASYQRYQGDKLSLRFNAYSYVLLSKSMDGHNVGRGRGRGRGRGGVIKALKSVQAETLVIGISTDLLFPVQEQRFLAEHIQRAKFSTISSDFGHDGFLIEFGKLEHIIRPFLTDGSKQLKPFVKTAFRERIKTNSNQIT
jgi:homoserine O-acetyltransferase